ncbi:19526_t:CDS:2 [Entrophospora sp. SA101]|nr:19526_t:CDS:2 [Entrophospora sp. SA101]
MNNYPISDFIVPDPDTHRPWRPSEKLLELLDEFEKKILYDHPSTPCAYCSILMMSTAAKWVDYDPDETYDLTTAFPKLQLPLRMNNQDCIRLPFACRAKQLHRTIKE